MTILNEKEALSREEKFVALAHIYLELHLSLQGAMSRGCRGFGAP